MSLSLVFEREGNDWYVILPEYPGPKADLQMVCGADTMLDLLAQEENKICIEFSREPIWANNTGTLELHSMTVDGGAYYTGRFTIINQPFALHIWLCDVTIFIFNHFPKKLYLKKIW